MAFAQKNALEYQGRPKRTNENYLVRCRELLLGRQLVTLALDSKIKHSLYIEIKNILTFKCYSFQGDAGAPGDIGEQGETVDHFSVFSL